MTSNIIPFNPELRTPEREQDVEVKTPLEEVYIAGEVEIRPGIWIELKGIPLNLTFSELSKLNSTVFNGVIEYAQDNGYIPAQ